MTEYHLRLPSTAESVGRARRSIVHFASQWFSGEDLSDIECAVGEALANSVEHSGSGTWIDVVCAYNEGRFTIEVRDRGSGFASWKAMPHRPPPPTAMRGYGIFIMRALMDEIEYGDRGRRLRLMKKLHAHAHNGQPLPA
jgi:anti-sigma regulatory factor (Ser/Thr protein kinase)